MYFDAHAKYVVVALDLAPHCLPVLPDNASIERSAVTAQYSTVHVQCCTGLVILPCFGSENSLQAM